MAEKETKKFNDSDRKKSLMRSMERRESKDVRDQKSEMSTIRK